MVPASPRCEVTVTLCNLAAGELDFGGGCRSFHAGDFIQRHFSFAAARLQFPRMIRQSAANSTGLLNPRNANLRARFAAGPR